MLAITRWGLAPARRSRSPPGAVTLRSYHVSLSRGTVDEAAWQRLCERWDGAEVVLAIDYITVNGVAVLSWAGLGADADAWALYEQGEFGHKWRDNRFGLHISM